MDGIRNHTRRLSASDARRARPVALCLSADASILSKVRFCPAAFAPARIDVAFASRR